MTSIFLAISAGNSPENAMFTNFGFKHIVSAMALINSGSNPVASSSFINDVGGAASEMPTVSVPCSIKLGGCGKQSEAASDSSEPEASTMVVKIIAPRRNTITFSLHVQKETDCIYWQLPQRESLIRSFASVAPIPGASDTSTLPSLILSSGGFSRTCT